MHETKTTQRVDMLSLLIVSNNPKAKLIQNFIQPLVKSKITLVADFEHGLNEVFDNRPATIIIQDLIAGVASGPATRHIRQMLGNDAPAVIMIQEGSTGISPVEGIFDYIVNLDQSDETLIAEISSNVKNIISGKPGLPPSPRIPVESAAVPVEADIAAVTPDGKPLSDPDVPGIRKSRILLVEDNLIVQRVALTMLSNLGCVVDIVPDGQQAVTALELINYDMVLMDWMMPRMDGLEATARIRGDESNVLNHAVPIIALTSNTKPGDREKCLDAGMNDYLAKPVNKAYLAEVIKKWLNDPDTSCAAAVESDQEVVDVTEPDATTPPVPDVGIPTKNVLLVEDNLINQRVALSMLNNLGCNVDIVPNGQKAVAALELKNYDMVLMDWNMPRMDGIEATVIIRDRQSAVLNHAVPIIALTSNSKPGDREKCLEAGMSDYLSKPVKKAKLAKVIEKWLNNPDENEVAVVEGSETLSPEVDASTANVDVPVMAPQNIAELDSANREQLEDCFRKIESLEQTITEKMVELDGLNEQLQIETDGRSKAEEALGQAGIDAEALNEQLQVEADGRSRAEEALRQAGIDAEALKEQLQVERDDWEHQESSLEQTIIVRTRELAIANEQVQVERDARKDAEENLGQVTIACEALNKQVEVLNEYLQAERAERSHVESKLKQEQELLAKIIDDLHAMPTGTVNESVATMVDRNTEAMPHPADSPFRTGGKSSDPPSLSRLRLAGFLLTALVMASAVTGGWYLFKMKQKLSLPADQSKKTASSVSTTPAKPRTEKPVAVKPPVAPAPANKKTMTDVPKSDLTVPSFVTVSGRDSRFSVGNAAWERYVDAKYDIRIYREAGRLKAVQVLAAKGHVIVESFMRDALHEVAGSSDYKRTSSETKEGFLIQRYSVGASSRLVVYRELQSNKISAFVVQL